MPSKRCLAFIRFTDRVYCGDWSSKETQQFISSKAYLAKPCHYTETEIIILRWMEEGTDGWGLKEGSKDFDLPRCQSLNRKLSSWTIRVVKPLEKSRVRVGVGGVFITKSNRLKVGQRTQTHFRGFYEAISTRRFASFVPHCKYCCYTNRWVIFLPPPSFYSNFQLSRTLFMLVIFLFTVTFILSSSFVISLERPLLLSCLWWICSGHSIDHICNLSLLFWTYKSYSYILGIFLFTLVFLLSMNFMIWLSPLLNYQCWQTDRHKVIGITMFLILQEILIFSRPQYELAFKHNILHAFFGFIQTFPGVCLHSHLFCPACRTNQRDVRKDAGNCWAAERLSRFLYL